jgi:hypothetical protein
MSTQDELAVAPSSVSRQSAHLERARAIAQHRGGVLLSEEIPNVRAALIWQCAKGHRWRAPLLKVKSGTWCATCAGNSVRTIEDMRELATERGGKCLSERYVNTATRLQWRCSKSHEWWARPNDIHRTWCPVCARNRKLELKDLRKIARERGGVLLSKRYVNNREPLMWRCIAGHVWAAAAASVKPGPFRKGSWCPLCPRRNKGKPARLSLEEMQQIARDRGGECLSGSYLNCFTKLKWRCTQGHEWEAQPAQIKSGTWCPACAGTQKLTLQALLQEAILRGGKLLSTEYVNGSSPLLWECSEGHRWETGASKVRYGSWCPDCAAKSPLTIEQMHELARANGGECLSKRYVDTSTSLKWRCARGHVWKARPGMVKPTGYQERGTWCPQCARTPRYTLEDVQSLAAARGGECLSKTYVNNDTPLQWRCAEGHIWKASPNRVRPYTDKSKGSWCPVCAVERSKLMIEDMRSLARARGGECLSTKYQNSRTPLRWRCAEGHEWHAKPNHVRPYGPQQRSSWCPICAGRHE